MWTTLLISALSDLASCFLCKFERSTDCYFAFQVCVVDLPSLCVYFYIFNAFFCSWMKSIRWADRTWCSLQVSQCTMWRWEHSLVEMHRKLTFFYFNFICLLISR
ncbi:hypothetical protein DEU56DRAFT_159578 [Suillus clintonianus]|uniref:uncharacterized protein n=1 Tax=Suillus clintonianus TaxID=1904413 RepID=UPI001B872597|nr:uncharacterized protein DEU56DRAFT_159578 [Suillus clintonianus]KAG2117730.1 hypothetical protein DEU56DRAFT_159578 [Suillus clintonianus]